jgi:enamine deaminase RidA (YjgF/YER057c/UK114 family)
VDRPVESPHRLVNAESLSKPSGFSHAVVAQAGRTVYLAGQTALTADGTLRGGGIVEQFDQAAANVVTALDAAGAHPQDLVSMQIFVTDLDGYRKAQKEIGRVYQRHFGRHYPAMALLEVHRLFDDGALVELMGVAVMA